MAENNGQKQQKQEKEVCGLIMPISPTDGYTPNHWEEVKSILEEAIESAGFKPNIVSDADDVGIIHNRIVGNLGENPIVVCDVSSKNPNVMFELGLRLAFDKPTIIVKDNITNYNFDTSPIEHLGYPVELNYHAINTFKKALKSKLEGTYKKSKEDPNYSTFLKHFVQYKRKLDEKEVGTEELILKRIEQMSSQISLFQQYTYNEETILDPFDYDTIEVSFYKAYLSNVNEIQKPYTKDKMYNEFERYLLNVDKMSVNQSMKSFIYHLINKYFDEQIAKGNFNFINHTPKHQKRNLLDALRDKYGDQYNIEEYTEKQ